VRSPSCGMSRQPKRCAGSPSERAPSPDTPSDLGKRGKISVRTCVESMTSEVELAHFMRWALADGPLPPAAVKAAMEAQGLDTRSQKQLTNARRRAGVICPRHGAQPQWQEWRLAKDLTSPMPRPDTWAECESCHYTAWLPQSLLPRPCIHCPRGRYVPSLTTPAPAPTTTRPHCDASAQIDLSQWKSMPSPLRTRAMSRKDAWNRARSWR